MYPEAPIAPKMVENIMGRQVGNTITICIDLQQVAVVCESLPHIAAVCNTLQQFATVPQQYVDIRIHLWLSVAWKQTVPFFVAGPRSGWGLGSESVVFSKVDGLRRERKLRIQHPERTLGRGKGGGPCILCFLNQGLALQS